MKPTARMYTLSFLCMGLFGALIFFLWDQSEGRPFDMISFLLRTCLFGIGGVLQLWLTTKGSAGKQSSSANSAH